MFNFLKKKPCDIDINFSISRDVQKTEHKFKGKDIYAFTYKLQLKKEMLNKDNNYYIDLDELVDYDYIWVKDFMAFNKSEDHLSSGTSTATYFINKKDTFGVLIYKDKLIIETNGQSDFYDENNEFYIFLNYTKA